MNINTQVISDMDGSKITVPAPLTVLQRALMGTTLTPEQQDAVFACVSVFSVSYDDCPEDIAAVMEPLMKAEQPQEGYDGPELSDLFRTVDEARKRCNCPFLGLRQGRNPDNFQLVMMVPGNGGTVMRTFSDDVTEEEACRRFTAMTKDDCTTTLRSLADGMKDADSSSLFRIASYMVTAVR